MANAFTLFGTLELNTGKFENSLHDAEVRLNQAEQAINRTESSFTKAGNTSATTARSIDKLTTSIAAQKDKMAQAIDSYARGEITQSKFASAMRSTDTTVNRVNSRLADMNAKLTDSVGKAKSSSQAMSVFKGALTALGVSNFASFVKDFVVSGGQMAASLDKLTRFTATLDKNFQSPESLRKFREDIKQLSTEIPHSADSIAKASFTIKSAFQNITEPELINYLREFGNAATASNTDIATHAENLAALAKQYNVTGGDLRNFSALIASSFGQALATDQKVAAGFNLILNSARSIKQPLNDMVAAMSTLQSASNDAEHNTTLLLNVYSKLTDKKYIEGLKDMGVSVFDANGNFKTLNQLINEIANKLKGLNDQQVNDKLAWAKDQQARDGIKTLVRLVGDYNKQLAEGADQEAFQRKNELMLNSVEARWEKFTNRVNQFKSSLGMLGADSLMGEWGSIKGDLVDVWTSDPIMSRVISSISSVAGPAKAEAAKTGHDIGVALGHNVISGVAATTSGGKLQEVIVSTTAGIPDRMRGQGLLIGSSLGQGFVSGIQTKLAAVGAAAAHLGVGAEQALRGAIKSHSPSLLFKEIGQDVGMGFIEGITSMNVPVTNAAANMLNAAAVKKAIAEQAKDLKKQISDITAANMADVQGYGSNVSAESQLAAAERIRDAIRRVKDLRLELNTHLDKPIVANETILNREIDQLKSIQDQVDSMVADFKSGINGKTAGDLDAIVKIFGNPEATTAIKRQADVLGLQVEEYKKLALLGAFANRNPGEDVTPGSGRDVTGDGPGLESKLPDDSPLSLPYPPRIKAAWEDFWGTMRQRLEGFKAGLPSLKQALGENLLSVIERVGDVFGNAIRQWDGSFKGFFKSIAQGFADMLKEIAAAMIRLLIIKGLTGLFGSFLGGLGGGNGNGITLNDSPIGGGGGGGIFSGLGGMSGAASGFGGGIMSGLASGFTPAFVAPGGASSTYTNSPTVNVYMPQSGGGSNLTKDQVERAVTMALHKSQFRNR